MTDSHDDSQAPPPPPPPPPDDPHPTPGGQDPAQLGLIETNKDARTMGMLCHLASLAFYVVPIGSIIGPLIVWLIKKDEHAFVDDQGKESLNFQITVFIAALICAALVCVGGLGVLLLFALMIADLIFVIIASVRANEGVYYRYPYNIRLIT